MLECGAVVGGATDRASHFRRGQSGIEDLQIVDHAVLEAAVAKACPERQRRLLRESVARRLAVVDVLVQAVAHHVGLERRPVQIEPDARCPARPVVGHDEARPVIQRKRAPGPHGNGVAGPEVNHTEERTSAIERELEAAAAGIRPGAGLMQHDRAILCHGRLQPQVERERVGAREGPHAWMHDRVVAAEAEGGR